MSRSTGNKATQEAIDAAETLAARRAAEVYFETLHQELGRLGCATIMGALGGTTHVHRALVDGTLKGAVVYTFRFDDSPEAVRDAVAAAKRGVG